MVVALAVGAAVIVAAFGWTVSIALPPIIEAFAAAGGIAASTFATGMTVGAYGAPWIVPTAAAGLGLAGVTVAYVTIVRITRNVAKAPFVWSVPLLGVLAAFLVDTCKEFFIDAPLKRVIFSGVTGLMLVVAGYVIERGGVEAKIGACLFALAAPATIILTIVTSDPRNELVAALDKVSISTWVAVVTLLLLNVPLILLARAEGHEGG